jgi:nuclear pore complex protein Nup155
MGLSFYSEHSVLVELGMSRYMTEVRRLPLPQGRTEAVYQGFRELEESLISPFSFDRF